MKTATFILVFTALFPQLAEAADEAAPPPATAPTQVQSPEAAPRDVMVNADYLNIRDSEGGILCTVPFGTALEAVERHADGRRVRVRFPSAGHPDSCPREGIVNGNYLDPINDSGDPEELALVDVNNLSFRSQPRARHSTYRCSLKRGTKVKVVDENFALSDDTPWIKVAVVPAQKGCPKEGYVFQAYLRGVNPFIDLPIMKGTVEAENGSLPDCCERPEGEHAAPSGAIAQIGKVGKELNRKLPDGKVNERRTLKEAKKGPKVSPKPGAISNSKIEKMIVEAHAAARKWRNYAPHVCCRRKGLKPGCGIKYCGGTDNPSKSKGWCKQGVREAIYNATGVMISGDSATNSKRFLDSHFQPVRNINSCKEAPVGAICLYDRRPAHDFGHIEIRTGKAEYCSDFCTDHPIRVGRFMGAYLP